MRAAARDRRAARHATWLVAAGAGPLPLGVRRGPHRQSGRQDQVRTARVAAVAFARWARRYRQALPAAAARLGIPAATLHAWQQGWQRNHLRPAPRGRPAEGTDRATRHRVIAALRIAGPGTSVRQLQEMCPDILPAVLSELRDRYRSIHRRLNRRCVEVLRWTRAGRTWAIDFTECPCAIDGHFRYLLVCRDLASGRCLLALPCRSEDQATVRAALRALVAEHGAPLVLKSDNGSAFIAEDTRAWLRRQGMAHLLSPPGTPSYNGACEAGIGVQKTWTHHEAARHDRPEGWTSDDVEHARLLSNATAKPHGVDAPTPDAAWIERTRITTRERARFQAEITAALQQAEYYDRARPLAQCGQRERDQRMREAISLALVARGDLEFRRKRIPLPIYTRRAANF